MTTDAEETTMRSITPTAMHRHGAPVRPVIKSLEGQTALVTGANSGIGRAIAVALGGAGANVVVNYVSREDAAFETVEEVRRAGSSAIAVAADVSSEEQVQAMFARARSEFGPLHILVNNAGLQQDAPFHEMTLKQWDTVMNVNLKGQFLCTREAIRMFLQQGVDPEVSVSAGKVLCISSVHDIIPWAGHVNYAASKGGVMLMMKSVAQEVAPLRIRVNSICPGAIRTPINVDAWNTDAAYAELMKLVPYKRIGEPIELGRAAVWLASDDSDYVTGASIYVDGGMTLYPGFETGG
jgi:glucose 1-dehydrogenase